MEKIIKSMNSELAHFEDLKNGWAQRSFFGKNDWDREQYMQYIAPILNDLNSTIFKMNKFLELLKSQNK